MPEGGEFSYLTEIAVPTLVYSSLDQVNEAYADLERGEDGRGVIVFN